MQPLFITLDRSDVHTVRSEYIKGRTKLNYCVASDNARMSISLEAENFTLAKLFMICLHVYAVSGVTASTAAIGVDSSYSTSCGAHRLLFNRSWPRGATTELLCGDGGQTINCQSVWIGHVSPECFQSYREPSSTWRGVETESLHIRVCPKIP